MPGVRPLSEATVRRMFMSMRIRAGCVTVLIIFGIAYLVNAQQVIPKSMTKEEIEKELASGAPIRGEILQGEKRLCSFDSAKASGISVKMAGTKPSGWARTGTAPTLAVVLTAGSDPRRLVLVKDGALDSPLVTAFVPSRGDALRFELRFDRKLPAGDYEFAISSGQILLFPQCGFTVTGSQP
jgi:hypothetical protein